MTSAAYRRVSIVTFAVLGAVLVGSTSVDWFEVEIRGSTVKLAGSEVATAVLAMGLALLATAGALTIAGPVFRRVLSVLVVAIGVATMAAAAATLADPVGVGASALSEATGLSPGAGLRDAVTDWVSYPAPTVALIVGGLVAAAGLLTLLTVSRWPVPTNRFESVGARRALNSSDDAAARWDDLSAGIDPTDR